MTMIEIREKIQELNAERNRLEISVENSILSEDAIAYCQERSQEIVAEIADLKAMLQKRDILAKCRLKA